MKVLIDLQDNGPMIVTGLDRLHDHAGNELPVQNRMTLCRCGESSHKPYCDNTHDEFGYSDKPAEDAPADRLQRYRSADGHAITFNLRACRHAEYCWRRLPAVFNPQKKRWIDPDGAGLDAIEQAVSNCPSGALAIERKGSLDHGAGGITEAGSPELASIRIVRNGPYEVVGIALHDTPIPEGAAPGRYSLCRCGASRTKPWCDGSHRKLDNWE